ncbi:hypothetical protein FGRMN_28 [Fusarium graminum]|nr:hypothetical protein FGRMN_28 [Fusarium graminum]
MSTATSIFKTAIYATWSFQFGWLLISSICTIFAPPGVDNPLGLIILVLPISFEVFLLFTTASCFPALSPWTRRFNRFFYETRDWAMVLPVCSILWILGVMMIASMVAIDLISGGGPLTRTIGFINTRVSTVLAYIVYIGGMFTFIPLPFWTLYVGVQACLRVKNLKSPDEIEALGLMAKDDDDNEWNDFQDNRGN